jgi:L-ascorbate metabolism protein UlaG (beta-lactamase superfamily)
MKLVHLGDLGHLPDTDALKAALADVDVMLIPIGGVFTITTPQAVELIGRFRPKAAIAMHYRNRLCSFDISDSSEFIRLTGARTLPNEIELAPGALSGCYVMDI